MAAEAVGAVAGGLVAGPAGAAAGPAVARGVVEAAKYALGAGVEKYGGKKVEHGLDEVGRNVGGVLEEYRQNWAFPTELERARKKRDFLREQDRLDDREALKKSLLGKAVSKGVPLAVGAIEAMGRGVRDVAHRWWKSKPKSVAPKARSRSKSSRSSKSRSRSARRRARKHANFWEPRKRSASRHRRHRKRSKSRTSRSRSRHRRHKALKALRRDIKDKETERYIRDLAHGKKRTGRDKKYSRTNRWGADGRLTDVWEFDRYGQRRRRVQRYVYAPGYGRQRARTPYVYGDERGLARQNEALQRQVAALEQLVKKTGRLNP